MSDKKFEKLVAVEALNLFTGANEEFAKRAKEYVFYDDVPSSEEEVIRRAKDADGILVNLSTQITANIIEHCQSCAISECAVVCTMRAVPV